jgi:hypothetical protein
MDLSFELMARECHSRYMNSPRTDIVIRRADASDARALSRLAALDTAPAPLAGPDVLIAEVSGHVVAAVADGQAIADPFQPTAGLVELLHMRARQLLSSEPSPRSRPRLRFPRPALGKLAQV